MLRAVAAATLAAVIATAALAQSVKYGDDSGDYPGDGECDDRRFFGPSMASTLTWRAVGRDATDCRALHDAGRVELWDIEAARAATNCAAVKWGDDSSEYAGDGTCDDPRFEGMGSADVLEPDDRGRDAGDCRRLCEYGLIFLRDY
jgi:hypothetical protein